MAQPDAVGLGVKGSEKDRARYTGWRREEGGGKVGAGGWSQTTPPPTAAVQSSDPSLSGNINTITSGLRVPPPASHICQGQGALVSAESRRQGRPRRRWDWREVGGREASLKVRPGLR